MYKLSTDFGLIDESKRPKFAFLEPDDPKLTTILDGKMAAFSPENRTIYFKGPGEISGNSAKTEYSYKLFKSFAHEMRHAWQYARGLGSLPTDSVKNRLVKFRILEADAEAFACTATHQLGTKDRKYDRVAAHKDDPHILKAFDKAFEKGSSLGTLEFNYAAAATAAFKEWYNKNGYAEKDIAVGGVTEKVKNYWYEDYDKSFINYLGLSKDDWIAQERKDKNGEGLGLDYTFDVREFTGKLAMPFPDEYGKMPTMTHDYLQNATGFINQPENQTIAAKQKEKIVAFFDEYADLPTDKQTQVIDSEIGALKTYKERNKNTEKSKPITNKKTQLRQLKAKKIIQEHRAKNTQKKALRNKQISSFSR